MKTVTAFFLTLSVLNLVSASSLLAQEESSSANTVTQLDEGAALEPQEESTSTPVDDENAPPVASNEDFIPSEQIFEDRSATFPVDI